MNTAELLNLKSEHTEVALTAEQIASYLPATPDWALINNKLYKSFTFKNYYETLSFINAIAYVIHAEDHHPELVVTYNKLEIRFDTHSVNQGTGGISINDFICAAKIDAVYQQSFS